jgi:hypothetical protein
MPFGWYIIPYKRHPILPRTRYPAIDDYTDVVVAAGGTWAETEILGNRCLVKVRAPAALLDSLASVPEYKRLPKDRLDDSLVDLSSQIKRALRDELRDQGYTVAEIHARFGDDLGQYTLRDLLRFMATRRLRPRWNAETDEIILDGPSQGCRPIASVDAEVWDATTWHIGSMWQS